MAATTMCLPVGRSLTVLAISSNVTIMPNHGAALHLFWRNAWVGMSLLNVVCWRENATM
ncbi:Uncharacterised protein [Segatella copri]|nr:Uncharacterised protein [Segatella copri]